MVISMIDKLHKNQQFYDFEVKVKYSIIIDKIKKHYKYSNRTLALFFQINPKDIVSVEFRLATICVKTDKNKFQTDYDLLNVYVNYLKLKRKLKSTNITKNIKKI